MRILLLAGRRLLASIPTLLFILIGLFLLLQLAPGDTVDSVVARQGAQGHSFHQMLLFKWPVRRVATAAL